MPESVEIVNSLPPQLLAEIAECGFYPSLVAETVALGLGQRELLDFLVQHEATFAGHELHRHMTVLVRTARQLLICHIDEGEGAQTEAVATAEDKHRRAYVEQQERIARLEAAANEARNKASAVLNAIAAAETMRGLGRKEDPS
mgnify:CR=1 FL=1